MDRIAIVGKTGSGKTTLAQDLARCLSLDHIEIDSIAWEPNWVLIPPDELRVQVEARTRGPRWVSDGNYRRVREFVWGRADTLVWLDYPLWLALKRILVRTLRRSWTKEVLWGKNVERWYHLLESDSLLLYAIRAHRSHRVDYPLLFQQPEYRHLQVVRLRSPKETQHWLEKL